MLQNYVLWLTETSENCHSDRKLVNNSFHSLLHQEIHPDFQLKYVANIFSVTYPEYMVNRSLHWDILAVLNAVDPVFMYACVCVCVLSEWNRLQLI